MKHSRFAFIIAAGLISAASIVSCKSVPNVIPETLTEQELIQGGQTAYDNGNQALAEKYYQTAIQRYGNNTAVYIEARFEIAHMYLKEKRYSDAAPIYEEIISLYKDTEPGALPASYLKLASNDLKAIPDSAGQKAETTK